MKTMTEIGGSWNLTPGESIVECLSPWLDELDIKVQTYGQCMQCINVPFKVLIIKGGEGQQRGVQLCGQHFMEACRSCGVRSSCKGVIH